MRQHNAEEILLAHPLATQRNERELGHRFESRRRLFRRRATGEAITRDRKGGAAWSDFAFPTWWHYDVLRGLDYLRGAGITPDARMAEAIDLVISKRDPDGRWRLDTRYPGVMPIDLGETAGQPSRWITLRALRVLRWYTATCNSRVVPTEEGPRRVPYSWPTLRKLA